MMAAWLQTAACSPDASAALRAAGTAVGRLDTAEALRLLDDATRMGCADAGTGAVFLRGLAAARSAYAAGGSNASLEAVGRAVTILEAQAGSGSRAAALGHAVLMAAEAAAQSERDDMSTWLEQAVSLDGSLTGPVQRLIDLPVVTGDLWLQVHRFDAAREAYRRAAAVETSLPSSLGLARVAVRLDD